MIEVIFSHLSPGIIIAVFALASILSAVITMFGVLLFDEMEGYQVARLFKFCVAIIVPLMVAAAYKKVGFEFTWPVFMVGVTVSVAAVAFWTLFGWYFGREPK